MSDTFPFGNDLSRAESWLGHMDAKSRNWAVAYDGGFSLGVGYHSFIFLGLDSLSIGLIPCSPQNPKFLVCDDPEVV